MNQFKRQAEMQLRLAQQSYQEKMLNADHQIADAKAEIESLKSCQEKLQAELDKQLEAVRFFY